MASVRAINVPGIGEVQLGDWIDDHLWATGQAGTNQSADLQIFTSGRGRQLPGTTSTANDYQVYVPEPGRMPTGWEMLVFGISCDFAPAITLADIQDVMNKTLLEFWILGKVYSQAPMQMYPGGGGITGVTTNNAVASYVNGVAAVGAVRQFLVPHKIAADESYFCKYRFPAALSLGATQNIRTVLRGLIKRSVQ